MSNRINLAGCVILDNKGRILLIHRNTLRRTHWEMPGGKIDQGEDPQDTARREIAEELGVKVKIQKILGNQEFKEDDYLMHYTWYLAEIESGKLKIQEKQTFDELKYFSWEELKRMKNSLSPNARNFLNSYLLGELVI